MAYIIFLADDGAPKRRGARGSLPPLPYPLDGPGSVGARRFRGPKIICFFSHSKNTKFDVTRCRFCGATMF